MTLNERLNKYSTKPKLKNGQITLDINWNHSVELKIGAQDAELATHYDWLETLHPYFDHHPKHNTQSK